MFVEFVIPTYDQDKELRSMLASLVAQTDEDWSAHVIVDNNTPMVASDILAEIGDKRIRCTYMDKRYNDWGHTLREYGKQASPATYIVMSGDDNYYTPNFVQELKEAAKDGLPEFIYWDMIHSHYGYTFFKTSPYLNQIDIGAFATRADYAKQIKLKTSYAADGEYVQEFKQKFPSANMVKINKVLYVHN